MIPIVVPQGQSEDAERIRLFEIIVHAWYRERKRGMRLGNMPSLTELGFDLFGFTRKEVTMTRKRIAARTNYKLTMSPETCRFRVVEKAA